MPKTDLLRKIDLRPGVAGPASSTWSWPAATFNEWSQITDPDTGYNLMTTGSHLAAALTSSATEIQVYADVLEEDELALLAATDGTYEVIRIASTAWTTAAGTYGYTVERGIQGTQQAWALNTRIRGYTLDSYILLDAREAQEGAPSIHMARWTSAEPDWENQQPIVRLGSLSGLASYDTEDMGLALGELDLLSAFTLGGEDGAGKYLIFNVAESMLMVRGADIVGMDPNGDIVFRLWASYSKGHVPGDAILGRPNGTRQEWDTTEERWSIWSNTDREVFRFDAQEGGRILDELWIGESTGPQIGLGVMGVSRDTATIVARNVYNVPQFLVETGESDVHVHIGNPKPEPGWMEFETGVMTVDGEVRARAFTLLGGGQVEPEGYLRMDDPDSDAYLIIDSRHMAGHSPDGRRRFLVAWAATTLETNPGSGIWETYVGGTDILGDREARHFVVRPGAEGGFGWYFGDEPRAWMDADGNAYFAGSVTADAGYLGDWRIIDGQIRSQADLIVLNAVTGDEWIAVGSPVTGDGMRMGSGGLKFWDAGTLKGQWDTDSTFWLGDNESTKKLAWDPATDTATVAGWEATEDLFRSAASGARVQLDASQNRVSVFDGSGEKVVMGYLDDLVRGNGTGTVTSSGSDWINDSSQAWQDDELIGLEIEITGGTGAGQTRTITDNVASQVYVSPAWTTQPDGTSTYQITYTASHYGVWAAQGDRLVIDGDAIYTGGDWIVANDGSYLVQEADGTTIIRLGTAEGDKGLFIYDGTGTRQAKLTADEFIIGSVGLGEYIYYDKLQLTLTGGIVADRGTIGDWDIYSTYIQAGGSTGIRLYATTPYIKLGPAMTVMSGVGIWMGNTGGGTPVYEFRVGDPAGDYMRWTGSQLLVNGTTIAGEGSGLTNLDGANIQANTITATEIAAGTITATEIAANTITATEIAANTITATEIAANTITATEIQAGTITATEIQAGTITTTQIAANTITATNISTLNMTGKSVAFDTGTVGGWTLASNRLYGGSGSDFVGMIQGTGTTRSFFAGATDSSGTAADFYVTAAGSLYAASANIAGTIDANAGTLGSLSVDGSITVASGGSIQSANYASGTAGFKLDTTGFAEFHDVVVRGSLQATVLQYGHVQATNGSIWITPAAGKTTNTVTSVDSPSTFTIDVEDPDGMSHANAGALWAVDDIVSIQEPWIGTLYAKVSSTSDQTTFWRLTVVKQSPGAGTNYTYQAGAALLNYGQSGDGMIRLTADAAYSPYISIATHTGAPWTSTTERVRVGNLEGITGVMGHGLYANLLSTLAEGLEAHWRMNESGGTRYDAFGSSSLTDANTVGSSAAGKLDHAADFDASAGEYLWCADNADISFASESFTIAAWVKLNSGSTGSVRGLVGKGTGSSAATMEYNLDYSGSVFRMYVSNGTSTRNVNHTTTVLVDTWYLVVGGYDHVAGKPFISVNADTLSYSALSGVAVRDGANPFYIGSAYGGYYWDGLIDSVSIWRRALSQEEVTALYNDGAGLDLPFGYGTGGIYAGMGSWGTDFTGVVIDSGGIYGYQDQVATTEITADRIQFVYDQATDTRLNVGGHFSPSLIYLHSDGHKFGTSTTLNGLVVDLDNVEDTSVTNLYALRGAVRMDTAASGLGIAALLQTGYAGSGSPNLYGLYSEITVSSGTPGGAGIYSEITGSDDIWALFARGKSMMEANSTTQVALTVRPDSGTPTAHLQEWTSNGGTLYMSVSESGYLKIKKTSAPADAELDANELAIWWDQTNSKLMIKAKNNAGTVKAGEVVLS